MPQMSREPVAANDLPTAGELAGVAGLAIEESGKGGASAAEVSLSVSRALTVNLRKGEIESVEFQRDRDLALTVYFGQRRGNATTTDLTPPAIREAVQRACAIARHTGEDPYAGLAEPGLMAKDFPALDLDHPWDLSVDAAVDLAREAESAALSHDSRITNSEGAAVDTRRGISVYANTHGFVGHQLGTQHSLSCAVIAGEGDGMQRDYWYTASRRRDALEPAVEVGRHAAERSLRRLDPRRLPTQQAPVLLVPELARSLFGSFVAAVS
jgi:PmbA protein